MIKRSVITLLFATLSGCVSSQNSSAVLAPWYPSTNENGDPISAVFEGRVPRNEPALVDCDKIKVALVLYRNKKSKTPTSYKLARVYVATSPEGSRMVNGGTLTVVSGTKLDPKATVYRLDTNTPLEFRFYWVIGGNILFMLDKDLNPKVGTAGWSYVLNQTH